MNIAFTDKELQVIQLMVPEMTPEDTINKVLRTWYRSALNQLQIQMQSDDELTDNVISAHTEKISNVTPQ